MKTMQFWIWLRLIPMWRRTMMTEISCAFEFDLDGDDPQTQTQTGASATGGGGGGSSALGFDLSGGVAQQTQVRQLQQQTQAQPKASTGGRTAFGFDLGGSSAGAQTNNANIMTPQMMNPQDEKYDEPHHVSSTGCNHLRECPECAELFGHKSKLINALTPLVHTLQLLTPLNVQQQLQAAVCHSITDSKINQELHPSPINAETNVKLPRQMMQNFIMQYSMVSVCDSIVSNRTQPGLYPSYRAKGNIKISHEMTTSIIHNAIDISNGYPFMERSIGMQYNDGQIGNDHKYQILNMERMPPTCIPNRHVHLYKWRMHDALYRFTDSQATQLTGCPLPRSSRASFDTEQVSFDTQSIHHMIAQCKWNRKPVFKKKENKQRLTLCITQEHLNPMIQRSMMYNRRRLVPIVMFDNVANIHWIEYILFVTIQKDITIGVSLRYNERCGVQITGIHLDKMMIMEQHEVLLSHSQ
eukprot:853883_1